mgnify:FL=1
MTVLTVNLSRYKPLPSITSSSVPPGISAINGRAVIIPFVQGLGNAASQIKSPFLVVPVGGRAPVEHNTLPPR